MSETPFRKRTVSLHIPPRPHTHAPYTYVMYHVVVLFHESWFLSYNTVRAVGCINQKKVTISYDHDIWIQHFLLN